MTDKKLSRSMEILEVVIQMITFYSAFVCGGGILQPQKNQTV